jgi:hypothetical protein
MCSYYDPKYANENCSINVHADDSLDPLKCSNGFTNLVVKSQNIYSKQKTNAVLKRVTEHFRVHENYPKLTLYGFDLNHTSSETLSSLLNMMRQGWLIFSEYHIDMESEQIN